MYALITLGMQRLVVVMTVGQRALEALNIEPELYVFLFLDLLLVTCC